MKQFWRVFQPLPQCFVYELTFLMMSAYIQVSFSAENLTYNTMEKIFIVLIWLLVQIPGNIMLLGIIQFDRHGGDPLKRRIHDQVWNHFHFSST